MSDKPEGVFDNEEFGNGFIEFCASEQYQKYMKPFLRELIDVCRSKLEVTDEFVKWQARLSAIRQIDNMSDLLKRGKELTARGE